MEVRERRRGVAVVLPAKPKGYLAVEAELILREREERRQAEAQRRAARLVPNTICYKEAFADWKPGVRVPRCNRCDAILHPNENHKCEGFTPKYVEHDEEWHERQEAKRGYAREMREERRQEIREARMEMIREARLNGELYGREDDGHEDDDGWECEDDGVYGDDDGWDCD